MEILIINDYSDTFTSMEEPLFLNPDGVRTRFPIGWEGKGRYLPRSLKLYRASDNTPIDPNTYSEESNGIFFNFTSAPASGSYEDIIVRYIVKPEDYAFSTGSADSAYPGEEYFLFPNWNDAKGCGSAFWVGKYAASNEGGVPVSKKNARSWVNTAWSTQVASCPTKGEGFHCIRNREWVSVALWTKTMNIDVYGNLNGYNNTSDIDMRGIGTSITSAMVDSTDNYHKILTGSGPATFRHNGRIDGISDLAGNVWECVDGLQLRSGVPYILSEDNSTYVALSSSDMMHHDYDTYKNQATINYINNSTQDLLNEGLPVSSAGLAVPGGDDLWERTSGTRICYRGGGCHSGAGAGVWALSLDSESSASGWAYGFRLARKLV